MGGGRGAGDGKGGKGRNGGKDGKDGKRGKGRTLLRFYQPKPG
jgi:hypothetical protein